MSTHSFNVIVAQVHRNKAAASAIDRTFEPHRVQEVPCWTLM
ncbi:MAG: hypothetical protein OJF47_003959 [Nitrospira sp.]|nr:MAG: hypothetical protein OJF47_003959 [Nitrospira sp.]